MSESNALNPGDVTATEPNTPDELTLLKQQAALMGITHSNNIGVDALRKKVAAKLEEQPDTTDEEGNEVVQPTAAAPNPLAPAAAVSSPAAAPVVTKTLSQHLKDEALKLVRIRIACMDPKKQDLTGEIFTVANEYIGTVRKHVPFGEQTDNGYHVPYCIYEFLKAREFLHIQTRTVNGQIETKTRWVKEFSIEVLPPLTDEELEALAADQRATGRLDD